MTSEVSMFLNRTSVGVIEKNNFLIKLKPFGDILVATMLPSEHSRFYNLLQKIYK